MASCQKISQSKGQRPRRLEKSEQILHDANFIPNLNKFLYCDVSNSKPSRSVSYCNQRWLLEKVQLWWEQMGRILSIGEELFPSIIQGIVYLPFANWFVNLVQVWRHDNRIFGECWFGWVCWWRIAIIYVRAHRMFSRIL